MHVAYPYQTSGAGLKNEHFLLEPSNGQADLVGGKLVEMKANGKQTPSILLDFGQELHGGIEIVTGAFSGKDPINIQVTLENRPPRP